MYSTVAVGSNAPSKVGPATKVTHEYWSNATILSGDVASGVPAQPLGYEQTEQDAINRAENILKKFPLAQLGMGIEGGVVRNRQGMPILMSYIAITNRNVLRVTPTTGTPIPEIWAAALEAGEELRPLIMAMNGGVDRSAIGLLTNDAVKRDDTYILALRAALAPWANPQLYL
jgi:inosine/xanthosine triphosphatase